MLALYEVLRILLTAMSHVLRTTKFWMRPERLAAVPWQRNSYVSELTAVNCDCLSLGDAVHGLKTLGLVIWQVVLSACGEIVCSFHSAQ